MKPAIGCTEPAAIALAASIAFYAASGHVPSFISDDRKIETKKNLPEKTIEDIEAIHMTIDTNVLKNALYVSIPGTNHSHGIDLAAILGLYSSPDKELAIFDSLNNKPEELLESINNSNLKDKFKLTKREKSGIFIKAEITFKDGSISEALIRGNHSSIINIKYNAIDLIKEAEFSEIEDITLTELKDLLVKDMIYTVENNLAKDVKELIWQGIIMNLEVARLGLEEVYGDGIGFAHKMITHLDQAVNKIVSNVAAATDVRMSGYNIPVMTNVGSGNQGLIISVSLTTLTESTLNKTIDNFDEEEKELLIRAIALATVVTAYTTAYTGMLSNLCGCLCKAGVGSAAGMGYLLYHLEDQAKSRRLTKSVVVLNSMKNMVASTCGVLCDGAKGSCANKSKSAGFNAYTSAKEATMNFVASGGIPGFEGTDIKTIMKNFVETYIDKFGQPTDLHIVNYLMTSAC